MRVISSSASIDAPIGPMAVAIGVFDGVHLGHQALLKRAVELAQASGIESLAYSFHPHPAQVLAPSLAPRLIEPVEQRLQRIAALGVHNALVEPFTLELAATSPRDFVEGVLVAKLRARHVVVGEGFTFGHRQAGTVELLEALGEQHGFDVHAVPPVKAEGIHVSSTKVRSFVAEGNMRGARLLLGRPYEMLGVVVRGARRGTGLGFPTANLQPHNELIPGHGVYAARVSGGVPLQDAVVNVGLTPTFNSTELKVEVHLLNYRGGDLYGTTLDVAFIERLRDERRFESVEALKDQIRADVLRAREVLEAA